jgi:hypothetical protein
MLLAAGNSKQRGRLSSCRGYLETMVSDVMCCAGVRQVKNSRKKLAGGPTSDQDASMANTS